MFLKRFLDVRKIVISVALVALPAMLFFAASVWIMTDSGFKMHQILRDPAQQSGKSSFLGFVSNVGVWLWVSSVAICCFSLVAGVTEKSRGRFELLVLLAMLSLLLAVDDFFLLHERYIPQKGIFVFYALVSITLFVRHFRRIIQIDGFTFVLAGMLLASSIIIDVNQRRLPYDYNHVQVVEEGCKFIGAALWLFFCGRVASAPISTLARSREGERAG